MLSTSSKWSILLAVVLSSFLTPFMSSAVNIALPSIGHEFAMDAFFLNWISTSYLLTSAIFLVLFGRIADIYGRRRIFTYGILFFIASSFLTTISISSMMFIFFRILQGIGSAMVLSSGMAILTSAFPISERGKALGINVAVVYLGLSLGPFLGGTLIQSLGWRSIFLVNIPLGFMIIVIVFLRLKEEWREAKGEGFDFMGSFIYGCALTTMIYGLSLLPEHIGTLFILISVLGFLALTKWELRAQAPVLNINIFRNNRVFTLSNVAALISFCATFATGFLLSLYLQYIQGFTPQKAGLTLAVQSVVQALFSPIAGKLSDVLEPRTIASTGLVLEVVGLALFILIGAGTSLEFIIGSLVILGLGFALFSSPNENAIMSSVERRFYGVASGMVGTMRLIGMMLSMSITTIIFTIYMGRVQITPEHYPLFLTSMRIAFTFFASLCLVGVLISVLRGEIRKDTPVEET